MTVLWDCKGMIDNGYLPQDQTTNTYRLIAAIEKLNAFLIRNRPVKHHLRILRHCDNVRPHPVRATLAYLRQKNWEILPVHSAA